VAILDPRERHARPASGQVVACREGPPRALDDDAVHVAVVVGLPQRLVELGHQAEGERVQLVRPVEGDPRAAALLLIDDAVETAHGSAPRRGGPGAKVASNAGAKATEWGFGAVRPRRKRWRARRPRPPRG